MKSRDKAVFAVVAFVAMIAVVGFMTFNRYEAKKETVQAKAEKTEEPKEEMHVTNTEDVEAEIVAPQEIPKDITDEVSSGEAEAKIPEQKIEELSFSKEEALIWPIDGNVILNYSMDQTIYFATLDQYKYNPAVIISGELGEPVLAAADGKVEQVGEDARLGETITVDLGSGYQVVYGQLQEIRVAEGQKVAAGDVIGYINDPTKYYSVEGPNLYFQLLKDGEPENPLEYMEE